MCTESIDLTIFHNDDTVRILYTGDSLCNDQFRRIRNLFTECSPDLRIRCGIYRTGTVIQDQYFGLLK